MTALGEFVEERHQKTVHRIGNLTWTGYNAELSNGPFHAKRKRLAESNVEMNKEIAREVEWGFAQIEERGRRLAERALSIWPGLHLLGPISELRQAQLRRRKGSRRRVKSARSAATAKLSSVCSRFFPRRVSERGA